MTVPFVGNTLNGTASTYFGYIFGASAYENNDTNVSKSLKEVIVIGGNKITSNAFAYCENITSITLPNTITSIESSAFNQCTSLVDTYYNGTVEDWCKVVISSSTSNPKYYSENIYMLNDDNEYYLDDIDESTFKDIYNSVLDLTKE
jgi:hypothetical protein